MSNHLTFVTEAVRLTVQEPDPVVAEVVTSPQGPSGPGLPPGGTTGQVARKLSDSDFDIEWGDGSGILLVVGEVPSGLINGSNVTFALANTGVPESVEVFLNGLRQRVGAGGDYSLAGGTTITFLVSPTTGETVVTNYTRA